MSRKHASSSGGGVNLGIIVTPMLDMSFQLLAFFIMAYSPNASEEFIGGKLSNVKSTPADAKDAASAMISDKKAEPGESTLPKDPLKLVPLEKDFVVVLKKVHPTLKLLDVDVGDSDAIKALKRRELARKERWDRERPERESALEKLVRDRMRSEPEDKVLAQVKDIIANLPEEAVWAQIKIPIAEIDDPVKDAAVKPSTDIIELEDPEEREKPLEKRKDPYKDGFEQLEKNLRTHFEDTTGRKAKAAAEAKKAKAEDDIKIKTKVRIEADPGIQFEFVIRTYAACMKAGFDEIEFITP